MKPLTVEIFYKYWIKVIPDQPMINTEQTCFNWQNFIVTEEDGNPMSLAQTSLDAYDYFRFQSLQYPQQGMFVRENATIQCGLGKLIKEDPDLFEDVLKEGYFDDRRNDPYQKKKNNQKFNRGLSRVVEESLVTIKLHDKAGGLVASFGFDYDFVE